MRRYMYASERPAKLPMEGRPRGLAPSCEVIATTGNDTCALHVRRDSAYKIALVEDESGSAEAANRF